VLARFFFVAQLTAGFFDWEGGLVGRCCCSCASFPVALAFVHEFFEHVVHELHVVLEGLVDFVGDKESKEILRPPRQLSVQLFD